MAIRFRFGAPRANWIPLGVMSAVEGWDAPFPTETVAQLGGALAAARI